MPRTTIIGDGPGGTATRTSETGDPTAGRHRAAAPDRPVPGDPATAFHLARLYGLLALGFDRPADGLAEAIETGAFEGDLVESARHVGDDVLETARAVAPRLDDVPSLREAWTALFGVEEGVDVSPFELTYLPGPLVTNVRQLADLNGFYEAFGLEVAPERRTRLDHLCYLLEFLSHLSLREAYLRLEADDEGVAVVGDARRQFVEDHLGRWYWRFADEVSQRGDGFHARLADLLAAVLEDEIDRLDVEPAWVPDDPEAAEWTTDVFGDVGRGCGGCGVDHGAPDGPGVDRPSPGWAPPDEGGDR